MWSVWQTWKMARRAAGFLGGLLVALLLAAPAAGAFSDLDLTNVSKTPTPSMRPAIAVNATGQVFLAWREDLPSPQDDVIYFARSKPPKGCGGSSTLEFGDPLPLSAGTGSARNPSLAVADSGSVFVVWEAAVGLNPADVYLRRGSYTDTAVNFDQDILSLSNTPAQASTFPSVTADGSGIVFAAWSEAGEILVARSADGGVDKFPVRANLSGTQLVDSRAPWLGTHGASVFLAWEENASSSNRTIWYRQFSAGATDLLGTATPKKKLSGNLTRSISPALAVGDDGKVVVAWVDGTTSAVYVCGPDCIGALTPDPLNISLSVTAPSDARVARRKGSAPVASTLVAWKETLAGNPEIRFRVLESSAEVATVPDHGTAGASATPAAGVDSTGRLLVAWADDVLNGNVEVILSHQGGSDGGGSMPANAWTEPAHVNVQTMAPRTPRRPNLTVFIEPGDESWSVSDIDGPVYLNSPDNPALGQTAIGDINRNGKPDLMVKFDRSDLRPDGSYTITGKIKDKCPFSYTGTVDIKP